MDLWTGTIDVPFIEGSIQTLDGLSLSLPQTSPATPAWLQKHLRKHLEKVRFEFLSYVPTDRVPAWMTVGPSLQLTTNDPITEDWFRQFYRESLPKFNEEEVWTKQSEMAILVQVGRAVEGAVNNTEGPPPDADWGITELLLYATASYPSAPPPIQERTPPHSSPDFGPPPPEPVIQVRALPLSTRNNLPTQLPPTPPPQTVTESNPDGSVVAQYLAPDPLLTLNPSIPATVKKRRAEALERAALKKTKKMTKATPKEPAAPPPPQLSMLGKSVLNSRRSSMRTDLSGGRDISPTPGPDRKMLKRQASVGSFSEMGYGDRDISPTPGPERRMVKRQASVATVSTLSRRVSGEMMPQQFTRNISGEKPGSRPVSRQLQLKREASSSLLEPKQDPPLTEIEKKNMDFIKRCVTAEMDARGMPHYKLRQLEDNCGGDFATLDDEAYREEFRNVHAHTVKAATFALRREIAAGKQPKPVIVTTVIDKLMDVFLGEIYTPPTMEVQPKQPDGRLHGRGRVKVKTEAVASKVELLDAPLAVKVEDLDDEEGGGQDQDLHLLPELKGKEPVILIE